MTKLNRIKRIREEKGLTTRDLQKLTGLNHGTISRIENGFTIPTQITMVRISKALKMDVDEVFNLDWRQLKGFGM